MRIDKKWLRLGLATSCILLALLLMPVFLKNPQNSTVKQRYIVVNDKDTLGIDTKGNSLPDPNASKSNKSDENFDDDFFNGEINSESNNTSQLNKQSLNSAAETAGVSQESADSISSLQATQTRSDDSHSQEISSKNNGDVTRKLETDDLSQSKVFDNEIAKTNIVKLNDDSHSLTAVTDGDGNQAMMLTAEAKYKRYWRVQLGSFSKMVNVKLLQERLQRNGYSVITKKSVDGRLVRVLVGTAMSRQQALALKQELKRQIGITGIVVHE